MVFDMVLLLYAVKQLFHTLTLPFDAFSEFQLINKPIFLLKGVVEGSE